MAKSALSTHEEVCEKRYTGILLRLQRIELAYIALLVLVIFGAHPDSPLGIVLSRFL